MRRLIPLLLLPTLAYGQLAGLYGAEQTVRLRFLDADGSLLIGETDGGSEVTLSCDGGTPATATNDFGADTNTPGYYPLELEAAETECAVLTIHVAASVAQDFWLETYGNASAQHPTIGRPETNVTHMADTELCMNGAVISNVLTGNCD